MSKLKFIPLIIIFLVSITFFGWVGFSQEAKPNIRLITEPPLHQILPFEAEATSPQSPVKLTLQAVDKTRSILPITNYQLPIHIQ